MHALLANAGDEVKKKSGGAGIRKMKPSEIRIQKGAFSPMSQTQIGCWSLREVTDPASLPERDAPLLQTSRS
jgi:hypothetical protein